MKVAIYARTDLADQSTAPQIELCREYAQEKGWSVVGVYDDTGVSGLETNRDGLDLFAQEVMKYEKQLIA